MEWGVGKVDREAEERLKRELEEDKNRGYAGVTIHDKAYANLLIERFSHLDIMID